MNRALTLVLFAVFALSGPLASAQSPYGSSSLFVLPTAFTPPTGTTILGASWFSQQVSGKHRTEWNPLSLSYAISNRLEAGILHIDRLSTIDTRRGSEGLFVRGAIVPETDTTPAFTLAASYVGNDVQLASLAGVAGYHFHHKGRTYLISNVGLQWAWRGDSGLSSDALAAYLGAEVPIAHGLAIVGEYSSRLGFDYMERSGLGLMWRGRGGLSLALGYVNVGRSSSNRFFVGVGVPLGGNQ